MSKRIGQRKLLASAVLSLLVLAVIQPAYAEGRVVSSAAPVAGSRAATSGPRMAAPHAYQKPGVAPGTQGGAATAAAPHTAARIWPIVTPVRNVRSYWYVTPPGLYGLLASATSVTVRWYDRSTNELGFKVLRRDQSGNWQMVYQVATSDTAGSGEDYTYVDSRTDMSGQCYMITAYNDVDAGSTSEECTVRPDPSRFPQAVGGAAPQWSGLSNTNDGTGNLVNTNLEEHLLYGNQTWGVDLTWGNSSLWRVEAQGGPYLMKGQAVAIRVWGGGWLKHGNQTFGVDLQLSPTPVYEWYPIGVRGDASESTFAGVPLDDGGTFALWNSDAQAYLVHGYETWGVSLEWYRVGNGTATPTATPIPQRGVQTEQVLNCSVEQHAVEVFISDQTVGGAFVDEGRLNPQYGPAGCPDAASVPINFSPLSGHQYLLVATDNLLSGCGGIDDPQQDSCRKMTAAFVGDAKGYTRTDIVDDGVRITP